MIQWYPGHMAKAIREINEKVKMVDLVIVLLDARIPKSSFNPLLKDVLNNKRTLYVLTKKDKADDQETRNWINYYANKKLPTIAIDARNNRDLKNVLKEASNLMAEKRANDAKKGLRPRPIKTMIVGIPNVGKSTLINALVGKKVTNVADKPGVTKIQQWIRINQDIELLDTPGVLWPKFEDQTIGMNLAITGAIKDDILPISDIALYLINFMNEYYPEAMLKRYPELSVAAPEDMLINLAKLQKLYLGSGGLDLDRTARLMLQDFRNNDYGKITLDRVKYE